MVQAAPRSSLRVAAQDASEKLAKDAVSWAGAGRAAAAALAGAASSGVFVKSRHPCDPCVDVFCVQGGMRGGATDGTARKLKLG